MLPYLQQDKKSILQNIFYLPHYTNPVAKNGVEPVAKPVHLEQMKVICRKLSKDIKFSRIDLYVIDDKEYFGEITFYPAAGFGEFTPADWNERLGELINLDGHMGGGNPYTKQ